MRTGGCSPYFSYEIVLEDIVLFLIKEFPNCSVNIEPVTLAGRAIGKDELSCDPILLSNIVKIFLFLLDKSNPMDYIKIC